MLLTSIFFFIIGICFEILPTVLTLENVKAAKEIIPFLDFKTLREWGIILIFAGLFALLGKFIKK